MFDGETIYQIMLTRRHKAYSNVVKMLKCSSCDGIPLNLERNLAVSIYSQYGLYGPGFDPF
jgi:hypothetical protein